MKLQSRAKAYREYLKSPKAKVERILDNLDEERIRREDRAARRFQRFGWRKLARSVMTALLLILCLLPIVACKSKKSQDKYMFYGVLMEESRCIHKVLNRADGTVEETTLCKEEKTYSPENIQ